MGQYSLLAVDPSGNRNISYYDAANTALKYAGWFPPAGAPSPRGPRADRIPGQFGFYLRSANPVRGRIQFEFGIPDPGSDVRISTYDVRGRLVTNAIEEWKPAGRYLATWDVEGCEDSQGCQGIFFIRFEAGGYEHTEKIVVLH